MTNTPSDHLNDAIDRVLRRLTRITRKQGYLMQRRKPVRNRRRRRRARA